MPNLKQSTKWKLQAAFNVVVAVGLIYIIIT